MNMMPRAGGCMGASFCGYAHHPGTPGPTYKPRRPLPNMAPAWKHKASRQTRVRCERFYELGRNLGCSCNAVEWGKEGVRGEAGAKGSCAQSSACRQPHGQRPTGPSPPAWSVPS